MMASLSNFLVSFTSIVYLPIKIKTQNDGRRPSIQSNNKIVDLIVFGVVGQFGVVYYSTSTTRRTSQTVELPFCLVLLTLSTTTKQEEEEEEQSA